MNSGDSQPSLPENRSSYPPSYYGEAFHGYAFLPQTTDVAALRSAQWDARLHRLFLTLKREGWYMTQAQIDALVERWLEAVLEEAEDYRATCEPLSDQQWEDQLDGLSVHFDVMNEALRSCDYQRVEREADELLRVAALPALDHKGAEFGRLCSRLLQTNIEYTRIEKDRWEGSEPYKRHSKNGTVNGIAAEVASNVAAPVKSGPLFSVVVDKYFADNPRPDRTSKPMRVEFAKLTAAQEEWSDFGQLRRGGLERCIPSYGYVTGWLLIELKGGGFGAPLG